jgi:hypothetical protein
LFVFSNDHPFNPHVLLRRALSAENLELIDRGIFPVHLISKTARQITSKKGNVSTAAANISGKTAVANGELPAALYSGTSSSAGSVHAANFNGAARHASVPPLVAASTTKLPNNYPNPYQKVLNSYPPVSSNSNGLYGNGGINSSFGGNVYGGSAREYANERPYNSQQLPVYRGGAPGGPGYAGEYTRGAGTGGHYGTRGGNPGAGMSVEREKERYPPYRGDDIPSGYYPQDLAYDATFARGGGGRGSSEASMFSGYDRRPSRGELGGRSSSGLDEFDMGGVSGQSSSLFGGNVSANVGAGAIGSNRPFHRGGNANDPFGFDAKSSESGYQPFGNSQFY